MQIRRAVEQEAAELSELAFDAKRLWAYADAQMERWRPDLSVTAAMLAAHQAFVMEHEGRIAGFYLLTQAVIACSLEHLWVRPEFNRRGIGGLLLAHAQALAAGNGIVEIHIDSDPNAEAFYLRAGAQRVDIIAAPIGGDPQRIRPQLVLRLKPRTST